MGTVAGVGPRFWRSGRKALSKGKFWRKIWYWKLRKGLGPTAGLCRQ